MWRAQNEVLTAVLLEIQVFGNVTHTKAERRVASQQNYVFEWCTKFRLQLRCLTKSGKTHASTSQNPVI